MIQMCWFWTDSWVSSWAKQDWNASDLDRQPTTMSSERFPKVNSSTSIKTRFHCFDCTDNKLLSDWAQFPSLHPFFLLSVLPTTPALLDISTLTWWNREQRRRGDHQAWLTMIASLGGKNPQKSVSPWGNVDKCCHRRTCKCGVVWLHTGREIRNRIALRM